MDRTAIIGTWIAVRTQAALEDYYTILKSRVASAGRGLQNSWRFPEIVAAEFVRIRAFRRFPEVSRLWLRPATAAFRETNFRTLSNSP
jgi:hypothetical protein